MLAKLRAIRSSRQPEFHGHQLTHSPQTATRAERAGVDDEMIFASLMRDVGKLFSIANHPEIAALVCSEADEFERGCGLHTEPGALCVG